MKQNGDGKIMKWFGFSTQQLFTCSNIGNNLHADSTNGNNDVYFGGFVMVDGLSETRGNLNFVMLVRLNS